MSKYILYLLLFLMIAGCKPLTKLENTDETLLELADEKIKIDEFVYVYSKNNIHKDSIFKREDVEEYFDLFVNFKLKVAEAKALELDRNPKFIEEFEGYKKQLAKPYLTESKVTDELVREAYDRFKTEINASHILLKLATDASPQDSIKVYNKIIGIRDQAINGTSFEELAKTHSDDPSGKTNGGNLGYFSSMQMVYPFESAAYTTNVGEISMPVRTRFGYHIIKVNDNRPSQGKVKVAHIMIRSNQGMPEADKRNNQSKIDEIYAKLMEGDDWNSLCSQFSQDPGSNNKGGELPWLGTGNVDPTFESKAFELEASGDMSKPFLSPFGWHIIKLIEKKGLEPFEDVEEDIKKRIARDSRSTVGKKVLVDRLKKENNFLWNDEIKKTILSKADSSLILGNWNAGEDSIQLMPKELFSINSHPVKVDSFFQYMQNQQPARSKNSPSEIMEAYFFKFEEKVLTTYEESQLSEKYVDYRMILKEYYEGILLFELMDQKVWTKAVKDSVGIVEFFEKHKMNYQWDRRLDGIIINGASKNTIDDVLSRQMGNHFRVKSWPLADEKSALIEEEVLSEIITEIRNNDSYRLLFNIRPGNESLITGISDTINKRGIAAKRVSVSSEFYKDQSELVIITSDAKDLEVLFNRNEPLAVKIDDGKFEKKEMPVLGKFDWNKATNYDYEYDNRYIHIIQRDILDPEPKKLENIKGLVISDYQLALEKDWIAELKVKYPVKINKSAFEKSVKILENK